MADTYKGKNTVDFHESMEMQRRGELMRLTFKKYETFTRSEVETQGGRLVSRRLIFDPRVKKVRDKTIRVLNQMPRRETP